MSTASALLPTTVALSAESAINSILSDIPLFCEGIMGIGVVTYLFITKQAKLLSNFLYGSSFLAFAAATLDLGQVIARGPQKSSKIIISLDTVDGFIYAREVLLSLSILSLDLFFWCLVAHCPRGERADESNKLANSKSRLPSMHSASWNRWGIAGTVLKYGSLAALLSVPLLSMLWRLLPDQRKYATIYVVQATIQTSIMAIFILKLLLNVSISPLNKSWYALRAYSVPIASLLIGLALGISNLVLFAFTETILGRFLHAVEVYILIVHNLFVTFQDSREHTDTQNKMVSNVALPEKSNYNDILPLAYSGKAYPSPSILSPLGIPIQTENNPRQSSLSWILPPRRAPSPPETQTLKRDAEMVSTTKKAIPTASRSEEGDFLNISSPKLEGPTRKSMERDSQSQEDRERPTTTMSLSYYAMDYGPSATENLNFVQSSNQRNSSIALFKGDDQREITDSDARPSSLDEILRQQSELDQSIAALRLASMSIPNDSPFDIPGLDTAASATISKSPVLDQSSSTILRSKSESLSNRSDFSLSVFPVPPIISNGATTIGDSPDADNEGNKSIKGRGKVERPTSMIIDTETPQTPVEPQIDSPAVQYDVTSFIGDLSEPSRSSEIILSSEGVNAELEDTSMISSAQISPASGLRPMILASLVLAAPSSSTSPMKYNFEERTSLNPMAGAVLPLRPLLLGNPYAQAIPQRVPFTKVPLAQRRQRGGTISSNTRPAIDLESAVYS